MTDNLNRNTGANITNDQSKTWNNNHFLSIALFWGSSEPENTCIFSSSKLFLEGSTEFAYFIQNF
jgi:hypothetical protein